MQNRNFFVFHPIFLKFGTEINFEMLVTERRPNLKLENNLSKKSAIFYIKLYQALFNNSIAMETVDATRDWFVFKIKAYQYIVKVTKFEVPLAYRFSTAEGRTSMCPPPLFRVKEILP